MASFVVSSGSYDRMRLRLSALVVSDVEGWMWLRILVVMASRIGCGLVPQW